MSFAHPIMSMKKFYISASSLANLVTVYLFFVTKVCLSSKEKLNFLKFYFIKFSATCCASLAISSSSLVLITSTLILEVPSDILTASP